MRKSRTSQEVSAKPAKRIGSPILSTRPVKLDAFTFHEHSAIQVENVIQRLYSSKMYSSKGRITQEDVDFAASLASYHRGLLEICETTTSPAATGGAVRSSDDEAVEDQYIRTAFRNQLDDTVAVIAPVRRVRKNASLYERAKEEYFRHHLCPTQMDPRERQRHILLHKSPPPSPQRVLRKRKGGQAASSGAAAVATNTKTAAQSVLQPRQPSLQPAVSRGQREQRGAGHKGRQLYSAADLQPLQPVEPQVAEAEPIGGSADEKRDDTQAAVPQQLDESDVEANILANLSDNLFEAADINKEPSPAPSDAAIVTKHESSVPAAAAAAAAGGAATGGGGGGGVGSSRKHALRSGSATRRSASTTSATQPEKSSRSTSSTAAVRRSGHSYAMRATARQQQREFAQSGTDLRQGSASPAPKRTSSVFSRLQRSPAATSSPVATTAEEARFEIASQPQSDEEDKTHPIAWTVSPPLAPRALSRRTLSVLREQMKLEREEEIKRVARERMQAQKPVVVKPGMDRNEPESDMNDFLLRASVNSALAYGSSPYGRTTAPPRFRAHSPASSLTSLSDDGDAVLADD